MMSLLMYSKTNFHVEAYSKHILLT